MPRNLTFKSLVKDFFKNIINSAGVLVFKIILRVHWISFLQYLGINDKIDVDLSWLRKLIGIEESGWAEDFEEAKSDLRRAKKIFWAYFHLEL